MRLTETIRAFKDYRDSLKADAADLRERLRLQGGLWDAALSSTRAVTEAKLDAMEFVLSELENVRTPQDEIADAVARRGYRDGWTDEQFAARQVAKVMEEVAELARGVRVPYLESLIMGDMVREVFDNEEVWKDALIDRKRLAQEVVDVIVPALVLADVLGIDGVQAAVDKALADVERGKR